MALLLYRYGLLMLDLDRETENRETENRETGTRGGRLWAARAETRAFRSSVPGRGAGQRWTCCLQSGDAQNVLFGHALSSLVSNAENMR